MNAKGTRVVKKCAFIMLILDVIAGADWLTEIQLPIE